MNNYKLCFIISHKYYRQYTSYIKYYIDNINNYYENSLILIIDNNSKYIDDIKILFNNYPNVLILINDTECKFEIGAYKLGINYIINNNLLENYDYYIFTQDTFILKNKYDFNILTENNTKACAIHVFYPPKEQYENPIIMNILIKLNLQNRLDELSLCFANSFILNKSKISPFFEIIKDIVITNRFESECSERYLTGILYYLNDYIMTSIEGDISHSIYDFYKIDFINDNFPDKNFLKLMQQKNENSIE